MTYFMQMDTLPGMEERTHTSMVFPSITIASKVVWPCSSGEHPRPTLVIAGSSSAAVQPATTALTAVPAAANRPPLPTGPRLIKTFHAASVATVNGHVLMTITGAWLVPIGNCGKDDDAIACVTT